MSVTRFAVPLIAAGMLALSIASPAAAAPRPGGGGACVSDALRDARERGMGPPEAAAEAGFDNVSQWLASVHRGCGGPIETPPPF
jgi:hypothetical protein